MQSFVVGFAVNFEEPKHDDFLDFLEAQAVFGVCAHTTVHDLVHPTTEAAISLIRFIIYEPVLF